MCWYILKELVSVSPYHAGLLCDHIAIGVGRAGCSWGAHLSRHVLQSLTATLKCSWRCCYTSSVCLPNMRENKWAAMRVGQGYNASWVVMKVLPGNRLKYLLLQGSDWTRWQLLETCQGFSGGSRFALAFLQPGSDSSCHVGYIKKSLRHAIDFSIAIGCGSACDIERLTAVRVIANTKEMVNCERWEFLRQTAVPYCIALADHT